jgi:hypothetical protein
VPSWHNLFQRRLNFAPILVRVRSATRLTPPLVRVLEQLASKDLSAADIHRTIGALAAELGVPRPSYERTRQLVYELRLEPLVPGWGQVLAEVAWRKRPISALEQKATGTWPMWEDAGLHRKARRPGK